MTFWPIDFHQAWLDGLYKSISCGNSDEYAQYNNYRVCKLHVCNILGIEKCVRKESQFYMHLPHKQELINTNNIIPMLYA